MKEKTAGCNIVTVELIKIWVTCNKRTKKFCQKIYKERVWPEDFLKTVMIPIKKENRSKK